MQGQRITFDPFPEVVDFRQGSVSNSTGMSQQTSMNNTLDPVERALSSYRVSTGETTCLNAGSHDAPSFGGWNTGEPSSRSNPQNQVNDDSIKIEHGWSSSINMHSGAGPRLEEGRLEATNNLFPGRVNIGLGGNPVRSEPLFIEASSSNHIPQHANLNAGYVGNMGYVAQGFGSGLGLNLNKSSGVDIEQTSSASGSSDIVGASSVSSSYMVEDSTSGSGSSLGTWGLSCKRKALEGTSRQSYPGGSSSSSPQAANVGWHGGLGRSDPSASLLTPSQNAPSVSPPEQQNLSIGIGIRGGVSDSVPSFGVTGNAEIPFTNFGRRASTGNQQEAAPLILSPTAAIRSSNFCFPHQSPRSVPFGDSLELRPTAVASSSSSGPQNQPHALHIPGLSGNMHPFPWHGASTSRANNLSSSVNSGERDLRNSPRNNAEHPMFVPATDARNSANDPTSWSLATRNIGNSGGVPSSARVGTNSSIHTLPNPTWVPRHSPPAQNQQRLSEFPWSLFPSGDSESGSRSGHFPSLPPGPSTSSQDAVMSSGPNSQVYHQQHPRSSFFMERQHDDALGIPHSLRALAVDIEGRRRLISEIRQVLSAMRRGENLRVEEEYADGDELGGLDCGHDFHTSCIKQWLMQKNLCPICKTTALLK
ncbi:E3 ubiquitin-protein ligase RLIM [Morella rubra]|uniref:RING-type E3 ubiquitin transferase n=1 Tax=Morella rubra TaxID=262757 RepID=A0A6A1V9P2_9ROSI|nr:E3 ubiquitin-protein ligase RLIM [Morella rubra]